MNATEKVINDLNVAKNILCHPQMLTPEMCIKIGQAITSAIAMLKEQEAVAPFYEEGEDFLNYFMKHTMGRCGHCKAPLPALEGMRSKFCWMCGRRVKWE